MPCIRAQYSEVRPKMMPGDIIAFSDNGNFSEDIELTCPRLDQAPGSCGVASEALGKQLDVPITGNALLVTKACEEGWADIAGPWGLRNEGAPNSIGDVDLERLAW